jgi:tRNA(Ile)-lysidine synthase
MRFLRGTGLKGLSGMQRMRKWEGIQLIRPFLSMTREEIEAYCKEASLNPRLDTSNLSTQYTRNRMRLTLFPILHTYNPQFQDAIYQLSEIVKEEESVWEELTTNAVNSLFEEQTSTDVVVNVLSFLKLPIALQRRTIKLIVNSLRGIEVHESRDEVENIRLLAKKKDPSGFVPLEGDYLVRRVYNTLRFYPNEEDDVVNDIDIKLLPGVNKLPTLIGKIEMTETNTRLKEMATYDDWVVFDKSKLDLPLKVRTRSPGERMTVLGMTGSKKVKKVLIEEKIPQHIRSRYPLVTSSEDEVLWIPGVKRSNQAIIQEDTTRFIYLRWYAT